MKSFLTCLVLLGLTGCAQNNVPVSTRPTAGKKKPVSTKAVAQKKNLPRVSNVTFAPNGKLCAIVFQSWNIQQQYSSYRLDLWDVKTSKKLFGKPLDSEVRLAFLPDDKLVVNGDAVYLMDGRTGKILKRFAPSFFTKLFETTPDGRNIIFAHRDHTANGDYLEIRDAKNWKLRQKIKIDTPRAAFMQTIAFSPDGKRAVTGAWDMGDGIQAYNLQSGRRLWTSNGDQESNIIWSPDGQIIASSVTEGVFLLKPRNGRLLKKLKADYGTIVRFSADGQRLLFIKGNKPVVHNLRSGKEENIAGLPTKKSQLMINGQPTKELDGYFSEDGRLLAQVSGDGSQVKFRELKW